MLPFILRGSISLIKYARKCTSKNHSTTVQRSLIIRAGLCSLQQSSRATTTLSNAGCCNTNILLIVYLQARCLRYFEKSLLMETKEI
ncbi:MAG: hypothetical protein LBQ66_13770 [Planctomycetaceae bacterium]|nr:hypothetical protein [Planctomycetaceae bacterium]